MKENSARSPFPKKLSQDFPLKRRPPFFSNEKPSSRLHREKRKKPKLVEIREKRYAVDRKQREFFATPTYNQVNQRQEEKLQQRGRWTIET